MIQKLIQPIQLEWQKFQKQYKLALDSEVGIIERIAKYIILQKGKKLRPILILLAGKVCGEINEKTYRSAILIEQMHTATLIHDDVVDDADFRRGIPGIHKIWKNKMAVLMGDFVLAKALSNMTHLDDLEMLKIISHTAKKMSEGEIEQLERKRSLAVDEIGYFRLISNKTAILMETCMILGAKSVTDDGKQISALANFGKNIGIAFQIKDDFLDFRANPKILGKPVLSDIASNLVTLPLICALQNMERKDRANLKRALRDGKKRKDFSRIIDIVNQFGGMEKAEQHLQEKTKLAIDSLEIFPESEVKSALIQFANFNLYRKK